MAKPTTFVRHAVLVVGQLLESEVDHRELPKWMATWLVTMVVDHVIPPKRRAMLLVMVDRVAPPNNQGTLLVMVDRMALPSKQAMLLVMIVSVAPPSEQAMLLVMDDHAVPLERLVVM